MPRDKVGVGIIGTQFIAEIHAESIKRIPDAQLVAVASPTETHVQAFAERHGIPRFFLDYRDLLALPEVDMVVLGLPNDLHARAAIDAARAKKHVVCEKPLCLSLADADRMIEVCKAEGVKLMYAEELCFAPKYVRAKQLVDEGAVGRVYLVKQSEKHFGPHSPWFWDVERSGGGVTMDMGCHGVEFARWILGRRPATAVYASMHTFVHREETIGDDDAIITIEFGDDALGVAEESWAKRGGMDDRAEIYGSDGVLYANLLQGNSILTYSEEGYGYAVEKAPTTKGWSFTIYEEGWNYGFPQEMEHFVACVKHDLQPLVTGEDGRAVLEILFAAYESAGSNRKVPLPFTTDARRPIDLWRKR